MSVGRPAPWLPDDGARQQATTSGLKECFLNHARWRSDVTIDLATGDAKLHRSPQGVWQVTLVDTGLSTMTGGRLRRVGDYLDGNTSCLTCGGVWPTCGSRNSWPTTTGRAGRRRPWRSSSPALRFPDTARGTGLGRCIRREAIWGKGRERERICGWRFVILEPDVLELMDSATTVCVVRSVLAWASSASNCRT